MEKKEIRRIIRIAERHGLVVLEVRGEHYVAVGNAIIAVPLEVGLLNYIEAAWNAVANQSPEKDAEAWVDRYGKGEHGAPATYQQVVDDLRGFKHRAVGFLIDLELEACRE